MRISIPDLKASEQRFEYWKNKSGREEVRKAIEDENIEVPFTEDKTIPSSGVLPKEVNLEKRKEMLTEIGNEPVDFAFERAIGKNDSVYSNFTELIDYVKKRVGRIVIKKANQVIGYATGFMVSPSLMLTNWHVFKEKDSVGDSEVQFYYELDIFGNAKDEVTFKLDTNIFFYSDKTLDYCFVAVSQVDKTNQVALDSIGYLFLDPSLGKLGNEEEEKLNIIHHPGGDYKQLSIRENTFIKILPEHIWYKTDTATGSSGSPVFNDQWQVVALHHKGVPNRNAQNQIVDKDGLPVPIINNTIDETKVDWIANEGVRISVLLKDVIAKHPGNTVVESLSKSPAGPSTILTGSNESQLNSSIKKTSTNTTNTTVMESSNDSLIRISLPAQLLSETGNLNINISNRFEVDPRSADLKKMNKSTVTTSEELLEEVKKIDRENAIDYSGCNGYSSNFLGFNAAIPKPLPKLKPFIQKLKGSSATILRYYNYSVLFHSVRMQPAISAINVDGNQEKRKDTSDRGTDIWLRDNRIDYDVQLNDQYYRSSGFDKGHMSRREDGNWGDNAEEARRNADFTCMYTNACPQVNKLNQSKRGGLWGKLETIVLEQGAYNENGRLGKISVFNGPVFKDSDPVYKGIQIPMEFFKIVLWLNDSKKLKATAFLLSQSELVADIDFEALDLDQNLEFKPYMISIAALQKKTNLDFSQIAGFDTFKDDGSGNETLDIDDEMLVTNIVYENKKKG